MGLLVATVQQACGSDRDGNLAASDAAIRALVKESQAELILLPELHTSPYFCQTADPAHFDLAETIPGPTTEHLGELAKELNVVIVGSLFERRQTGLYHNTAVVLDRNGEMAGYYRKMHIPDDPGYYEKFYFTPGDAEPGFRPIDTSIGRLGVLVCWDQWYPEAARLMALAGADILLYPTAIGFDAREPEAEQHRQLDAWITLHRAHAIANAIPVLACNRVGHESDPAGGPGTTFWGHSLIVDAGGVVIAAADEQPAELIADLDMSYSESLSQTWPFLRDRRIDAYGGLSRRGI